MLRKLFMLCFIVNALVFQGGSLFGQNVLAEYDGSLTGSAVDPISAIGGSWIAYDHEGNVAPDEQFWKIIDDDNAEGSRYQYGKNISKEGIKNMSDHGWRLTVKMKMPHAGNGVFVGWGILDDVLFSGEGDRQRWGCFVESNGETIRFLFEDGRSYSRPAIDTHELILIDTDGDGDASIWLNGEQVTSGEAFAGSDVNTAIATNNPDRVTFGAGSSNGLSSSSWSMVKLEVLSEAVDIPTIKSIMPCPITGSNLAQQVYIKGHNFSTSSKVTLRDLRTGEVFPNRAIYARSDTQIEIRPIFTTEASTWSVEVFDGGLSSGQFEFSVLSPDTSAGVFYIEGPDSVTVGETAIYKCYMRNPVTNEVVEVSQLCSLGFIGDSSGSAIGGMSILAGEVSESTQITLQAYYTRPDDRIGSMPFTVTLKKRSELSVSVNASRSHVSGTNYLVNLDATAAGGVPPYTYAWDLDEDGDYDDETETSATTNTTEARTYRYLVRVTDSEGAEVFAGKRTTVNKPVPDGFIGEVPGSDKPDPQPPAFKTWNGSSYQGFLFDPSKRANGLIVITHGIRSSGETEWIKWMVHNIRKRTAGNQPNILVYDWKENADVFLTAEQRDQAWDDLLFNTPTTLGVAMLPAALAGDYFIDVTADAVFSRRVHGPEEGGKLAAWIQENLKTANNAEGNIDPEAPLHFIGHSAGGFVVGECAWLLQHVDHAPQLKVDAVTMLDTPFPFQKHILELSQSGRLEIYASSVLGNLGNFTVPIGAEVSYFVEDTHSWRLSPSKFFNHGHAPLWYGESARDDNHAEDLYPNSSAWGFNLSPIINEHYRIDKSLDRRFRLPSQSQKAIAGSHGLPVSGFASYGNATESAGLLTLTEATDAILVKNYSVPLKAEYLTFKYRFTTGGDGDFLTLYCGAHPIFRVTETSMNRNKWMTAKIPFGEFSGEMSKLAIRLVSRGTAQTVIEIKDLCIEEIADLDGDGVPTMEEYINGTDHRRWDTDGDLISDSDEAPLSDPLLRDSDSDGVDDFLERVARTDAKDASSFLKVVSLETQDDSSINLEWSSVTGKKYRVQWSASPSFLQYETISGIITAESATTSFLDTRPENETKKAGFYRAMVLEAP